jgi:hypothetical protein
VKRHTIGILRVNHEGETWFAVNDRAGRVYLYDDVAVACEAADRLRAADPEPDPVPYAIDAAKLCEASLPDCTACGIKKARCPCPALPKEASRE